MSQTQPTPPSGSTVPTTVFASLIPKLASILEMTQKAEGASTPEARNALLQTTTDFKNALKQARELAISLPGGEMLIEEQIEVIAMLEEVRDRKKEQLAMFAERVIKTNPNAIRDPSDSMASTPGF